MHSVLPTNRGIMARGGSDHMQTEMAQKNAALWIQYSALSISRSCGTKLLDNGGIAAVLTNLTGPPGSLQHRNKEEWTDGVIS